MKKHIFLTMLLSVCVLNYGAFAAPQRTNARGANASAQTDTAQSQVVSARAAVRGASKTSTNTQQSQNVSARAATRQKVVSNNVANNAAAVSARAASTQKVLQTGTKVATATTNTTIPQECQDAFYGCMDSFCMLDNVSGGRCQCSDRSIELDKALADILKLDEQSYIMATEGVERIQMGEAEDQIIARAKAVADQVVNQDKVDAAKSKKIGTLDLSSFKMNSIFGEDNEDIFETVDKGDTLADKTGDALHTAATKMCASQMPTQCNNYSKMLQLVYAQRIKSDCVAYENSLKQQKSASQEKLLAAQKALREAALTEYRDQNKYATEGECIAAFDTCMQTTAGCGNDYSKCIADDTVLMMGVDGSRGQSAKTARIKTSASQIGISANTLAMLTDKAPLCESVLKQCQNVRATVWESYLKIIAPTLKSAEVIAESDRRTKCISNIVDCFSKSCAAKWPNQEGAEYDMCLSNPSVLGNVCQIEINKCGASVGDQVMEYVYAKLRAMRVDACTAQVKSCLLSDDRCGPDYAGCVGLDSESIANLCPVDKLTACMNKFNADSVRDYVAEIAQGLALQIDNKMAATCQNALDAAMIKVCGGTDDECEITIADDLIGTMLEAKFCKNETDTSGNTKLACVSDVNMLPNTLDELEGYDVQITGQLDFSKIDYGFERNNGSELEYTVARLNDDPETQQYFASDEKMQDIVKRLNTIYNQTLSSVSSDITIQRCVNGREVEGFGKTNAQTTIVGDARFPYLLRSTQESLGDVILNTLVDKYQQSFKKALETKETKYNQLTERLTKLAKDQADAARKAADIKNKQDCSAYNKSPDFSKEEGHFETEQVITSYNSTTGLCTITTKTYTCEKQTANRKKCKKFDQTNYLTKTDFVYFKIPESVSETK